MIEQPLIILAENAPQNKGELIAQDKNAAPIIDYFSYFQIFYNAYLEDIYLPLTNIIFPYGAISDPFDIALFDYIRQDLEVFQKKLESFVESEAKDQDFLNVSYDELLNTPVDEGVEKASSTDHQENSIAVQSQDNNFNVFGTQGSTFGLYREQFQTVTSNGSQTESSNSTTFGIPNQFYVVNTKDALVVPGGQSALKDPPEVELGTLFNFGNFNHLLDKLAFAARISGFEQDNNVGRDNFLVRLAHGIISAADTSGHFTYTPNPGEAPAADEFTFFVSALRGGLLGIGHAFISQIKDQHYEAALYFNPADLSQPLSFSVSGSLLEGAAASKGATLSIEDVFFPDIGLNGLYVPIEVQNPINFTSQLFVPGANTHLLVQENGNFNLQSVVINPSDPGNFPAEFSFDFIVGNGHGSQALATATVVPVIKPVVLDLTGEGFNLVAAHDSHVTLGQLTGSQNSATIGWVGQGNGILMYDYDNSHQLSNLNQISFLSYVDGAKSDLEGLYAFDSNHNHMLDEQDDAYQHFGVVLDNGNYNSLSQLGIVSLSLDSQKVNLTDNGNLITALTLYQTQDGTDHLAADVGLRIAPPPAADPTPIQPEVHALA